MHLKCVLQQICVHLLSKFTKKYHQGGWIPSGFVKERDCSFTRRIIMELFAVMLGNFCAALLPGLFDQH